MQRVRGGLLPRPRERVGGRQPVHSRQLLPRNGGSPCTGCVPHGIFLPRGLGRTHAVPCGKVWRHYEPHHGRLHGFVRRGLLHGNGQQVCNGQSMQCGHLLLCQRCDARGHSVHRGGVLPCWDGPRGNPLPLWLLHVHNRRHLVYCLHGGLLLCNRQHLWHGEPVRRGLLLPRGRHQHHGGCVPQGVLLRRGLQRADAVPCGHLRRHNRTHHRSMHGLLRGGLLRGHGQRVRHGQALPRGAVLRACRLDGHGVLGCGHLLSPGHGPRRAPVPRGHVLCRHGRNVKGHVRRVRCGHVLGGGRHVVRRVHCWQLLRHWRPCAHNLPRGLLLPCKRGAAYALPSGKVRLHYGTNHRDLHEHLRRGLLRGHGQRVRHGQALPRGAVLCACRLDGHGVLGCGHLLPAGHGPHRPSVPRGHILCRHGRNVKGHVRSVRRRHVLGGGRHVVQRLHRW
jgi:hypothetical protein